MTTTTTPRGSSISTSPAPAPPAGASLPLAARGIRIVTEPPGPRARERIAHDRQFVSPSLIFCYPLYVARASGCMVEAVDGNVYLASPAGVATATTGPS